jgi:hypothetical protein
MKPTHPVAPISRFIDRDLFARNLLVAIEPLSNAELHRFLDQCTRDNGGTEGEALIIELVEGQLVLREIRGRIE